MSELLVILLNMFQRKQTYKCFVNSWSSFSSTTSWPEHKKDVNSHHTN